MSTYTVLEENKQLDRRKLIDSFFTDKLDKKYYNNLLIFPSMFPDDPDSTAVIGGKKLDAAFFFFTEGYDNGINPEGGYKSTDSDLPSNIKDSFLNNLSSKLSDQGISIDMEGFEQEATTSKIIFTTVGKEMRGFAVISSAWLLSQNEKLQPSGGSSSTKPSVNDKTTTPINSSLSTTSVSPDNLSMIDGDVAFCIYKFSDLKYFSSVSSTMLREVAEKVNFFEITLDKQINYEYQAQRILTLQQVLQSYITSQGQSFDPNTDFIKLSFDKNNFTFKGLVLFKNRIGADRSNLQDFDFASPGVFLEGSETIEFFKDSTSNSIVFNLSTIYNRYVSFVNAATGRVFNTADSVTTFLNKYIYPKPAIVSTGITNDLISSFILGDVRLLEEDFYKEYLKTTALATAPAFRYEMQSQISSQYEAIGDIISEKFFQGKFREITSTEEFFEDLLDNIPIKDLVSVVTKCLLKVIPIGDLLDEICDPIIRELEKHKQHIIQELESMDDGIAKDMATRLKDIYFDRVLNEEMLSNQAEQVYSQFGDAISNAATLSAWKNHGNYGVSATAELELFFDRNVIYYKYLAKSLGPDDVVPQQLRAEIIENEKSVSLWSDNLLRKRDRLQERIDELKNEKTQLQSKAAVFDGNNEPAGVRNADKYYNTRISTLEGRLADADEGIGIYKRLVGIYSNLFETIYPSLVKLSPYLKDDDKNQVFVDNVSGYFAYNFDMNKSADYYINLINGTQISLDNTENNNPITVSFSFPSDYNTLKIAQRREIFSNQLTNLLLIFDEVEKLDQKTTNIINQLENIGEDALQTFKDEIFGDQTQKYYLCLAILSVVPAAAYMLAEIIEDPEGFYDEIKGQVENVTDAVVRKVQLFSRYDYPYLDILKEIAEQLKQILINFTRDLIVNGIMYGIEELRKLCSEDEVVNTPGVSPIGGINLSEFMSNSKKGINNNKTGDVSNSSSLGALKRATPEFTKEEYLQILSVLSEEFTIGEMFLLMTDRGTDFHFDRAIKALLTLVPFVIQENGDFYNRYLNNSGIRKLISLISKDIDPALLASAKSNYDKQKAALMDFCFGGDDSLLFTDLDSVRDAMIANLSSRAALVPQALDIYNKILEPTKLPEPCQDGRPGILSDAQKFTAKQISDSIFQSISDQAVEAVVYSKNAFLDLKYLTATYADFFPDVGKDPKPILDIVSENQAEFQGLVDANRFVSRRSIRDLRELITGNFSLPQNLNPLQTQLQLRFKLINKSVYDEDTGDFINVPNTINLNHATKFAPGTFSEIDLSFFTTGKKQNQLNFEYNTTITDSTVEPPEKMKSNVASYTETNYFNELTGNLPETVDVTPKSVLFNPQGGLITQPNYNQEIKNAVMEFCLLASTDNSYLSYESVGTSQDVYTVLLNSILTDLMNFSFKTGLYRRPNFESLILSPYVTDSFIKINGQNIDACFLGFFDKHTLTEETIKMAERLICFNPNSGTETPVNVAFIKVLFDAFIRAVVLKEAMQSFFVFGLFPEDLVFSQISPTSNTIYEQIVRKDIQTSLSQYLNSKQFEYKTFYNDVFRKFILEITQVIFQNKKITEESAFNFVINSQIQYVKNQFKKAYYNAFGDNEAFIGSTEYRILQENVVKNASEQNAALIDLTVEGFSLTEQIRAIQNDGLASYYELTKEGPSSGVVFRPFVSANKKTPFLVRQPEGTAKYIDFDLFFDTKTSDDPQDLTHDNLNGMALETFIEMKPNYSFVANPHLKLWIEQMLLGISNMFNASSGNNFEQHTLRIFLYETRLFLLFPQAAAFIETLDDSTYGNVFYSHSLPQFYDDYINAFGSFDLFYWLFKFNFEEDFLNNEESFQWYLKMHETGLFDKLDLSLSGKIRLGDFNLLLEKLSYSRNKGIAPEDVHSGISLDVFSSEGMVDDYKDLKLSDFKNFSNVLQRSISAISALPSHLKDYYESNFFTPIELFNNNNFIYWLFSKNLADIFTINTCFRLDMKIKDEKLEASNAFSDIVFDGSNSITQSDSIKQKALIDEKIGSELLQHLQSATNSSATKASIAADDLYLLEEGYVTLAELISLGKAENIPQHKVLSFPMFELKQQIPTNLDWFTFFTKVDKTSYFRDDEFFNVLDGADITSIQNINNILFSKGFNDVFSYYNKLKTFSNTSQKGTSLVSKRTYYSTYWWNIKGYIVSLKEILQAVCSDGDATIELESGIGNVPPQEIQLSEIRNALTDESLASFKLTREELDRRTTGNPDVLGEDAIMSNYLQQAGGRPQHGLAGRTLSLTSEVIPFGVDDGVLSRVEQQVLVNDVMSSYGDLEAAGIKCFDKEKDKIKEGFIPFVAIKQTYDHGFYTLDTAPKYEFFQTKDGNAIDGYEFDFVTYTFLPRDLINDFSGDYSDSEFDSVGGMRWTPNKPHAPYGPKDNCGVPASVFVKYASLWAQSLQVPEVSGAGAPPLLNDSVAAHLNMLEGRKSIVRGRYIKGGLGANEIQKLSKPISSQIINIYDLLSILLKGEDKKTLERLLRSFFLKEQTTIVSLIHRDYSKKHYPEVPKAFGYLIANTLANLIAAVAAANGDYQHTAPTSSPSNAFGMDDFEKIAGQIGLSLLKFFLHGVASATDPTWKTPWFAPGPITPFGVLAKLLEEDFSEDDKPPTAPTKPKGDVKDICEDTFEGAANFFTEFAKTFESTLSAQDDESN